MARTLAALPAGTRMTDYISVWGSWRRRFHCVRSRRRSPERVGRATDSGICRRMW